MAVYDWLDSCIEVAWSWSNDSWQKADDTGISSTLIALISGCENREVWSLAGSRVLSNLIALTGCDNREVWSSKCLTGSRVSSNLTALTSGCGKWEVWSSRCLAGSLPSAATKADSRGVDVGT